MYAIVEKMYDMTLTVIGNGGSNHDRCTGNKRDQDLIDIVYGTGQAANLTTERMRL